MRQLAVLSGKGGTGKTTVASAFISLSKAKAYADCDVDAPNLHLLYQNENPIREDYYALPKAHINQVKCIACGRCKKHCPFDAIQFYKRYIVDPMKCEGCGVCQLGCPSKAITFSDEKAGDLTVYQSPQSVFSTAQLKMGNGTSGKLVTKVKTNLRSRVSKDEFAVIDGSPGIGCPVIATLNGADTVLIVAEPSLSGISDMERIVQTARGFQIKIAVCVNKFDINPEKTAEIEEYCKKNSLHFVGKIPYDSNAVKLINMGKTVVEQDCPCGNAIRQIYEKVMQIFNGESWK